MQLLRFVTAGSVDDGKSTLIGRLLYDARLVPQDNIDAIERASERRGLGFTDLSLLTDGLVAEREQGITIDVAYRYFATPTRKYIVADCPGHRQYTRNMVTGASNADCAVLLVDATRGLLEQTRRHAAVCGWLGLPEVILAVNKLDRLDWSREAFEAIAAEFRAWCAPLGIRKVRAIPLSALEGDMVVHRGARLGWYEGPTLLEALEAAEPIAADGAGVAHFAVQSVVRGDPRGEHAFRAYAGRVAVGAIGVGEQVVVLPSGQRARVAEIRVGEARIEQAGVGRSVSLRLDRELDISRGDVLVRDGNPPLADRLLADIAWFAPEPLAAGARLHAKIGTRVLGAEVGGIRARLDLERLDRLPAAAVEVDELAEIDLRLAESVVLDADGLHSPLGRFILFDPASGATLGAGLVRGGVAA